MSDEAHRKVSPAKAVVSPVESETPVPEFDTPDQKKSAAHAIVSRHETLDTVRRLAETPKEARKGPYVKFVGQASHRIIRPHHWRQKFPTDKLKNPNATHKWNPGNGLMIPVKEFSESQLRYLLEEDTQKRGGHSFLLMDYNRDGKLIQVKR